MFVWTAKQFSFLPAGRAVCDSPMEQKASAMDMSISEPFQLADLTIAQIESTDSEVQCQQSNAAQHEPEHSVLESYLTQHLPSAGISDSILLQSMVCDNSCGLYSEILQEW